MDFVQIAQTFGIPVALLLIILWGIWRAGTWAATKVGEPLTARCVAFIDSVEKSVEDNSKSIAAMTNAVEQIKINSHCKAVCQNYMPGKETGK